MVEEGARKRWAEKDRSNTYRNDRRKHGCSEIQEGRLVSRESGL